jgi:hypothetical protein
MPEEKASAHGDKATWGSKAEGKFPLSCLLAIKGVLKMKNNLVIGEKLINICYLLPVALPKDKDQYLRILGPVFVAMDATFYYNDNTVESCVMMETISENLQKYQSRLNESEDMVQLIECFKDAAGNTVIPKKIKEGLTKQEYYNGKW